MVKNNNFFVLFLFIFILLNMQKKMYSDLEGKYKELKLKNVLFKFLKKLLIDLKFKFNKKEITRKK